MTITRNQQIIKSLSTSAIKIACKLYSPAMIPFRFFSDGKNVKALAGAGTAGADGTNWVAGAEVRKGWTTTASTGSDGLFSCMVKIP